MSRYYQDELTDSDCEQGFVYPIDPPARSHISVLDQIWRSQNNEVRRYLPADPESQSLYSYRSASEEQIATPIRSRRMRFSIQNEIEGSERTSIDESIPDDVSEYFTPRRVLFNVDGHSPGIRPFNATNYINNSDELLAIQYSSTDTTFERSDSPDTYCQSSEKSISEHLLMDHLTPTHFSHGQERRGVSSCSTIPENSPRHQQVLNRYRNVIVARLDETESGSSSISYSLSDDALGAPIQPRSNRYGSIGQPMNTQELPAIIVEDEEEQTRRYNNKCHKNLCCLVAGLCCYLDTLCICSRSKKTNN